MTAAETAYIVERVLLNAGIVMYVSGLSSDTERIAVPGATIGIACPTKIEIGVVVVALKPGGSWENGL